jgi:hypothetical protein
VNRNCGKQMAVMCLIVLSIVFDLPSEGVSPAHAGRRGLERLGAAGRDPPPARAG